ncbi:hypothetical protein PR202_gb15960 [Eleusine coracana subsp. coracana]|uniref:DUF7597 domain-containing protein n=1 Tax=Eleusine coracana subsp. coracana TaxID=191504 RepID=A0AAV5EWZ2_ELECO|nr:hypothetical protein PR202_gb15960 [Eleusine coracana subsp. coracana]
MEDSVGMALHSVLGGAPGGFHIGHEQHSHFRFSVASKAVGFLVHSLRRVTTKHFDVYFFLWHGGGADFQRDHKAWLQEEEQEWTLVSRKTRKSSQKRVKFSSPIRLPSPEQKASPRLDLMIRFGDFIFPVNAARHQPFKSSIMTDQSSVRVTSAMASIKSSLFPIQSHLVQNSISGNALPASFAWQNSNLVQTNLWSTCAGLVESGDSKHVRLEGNRWQVKLAREQPDLAQEAQEKDSEQGASPTSLLATSAPPRLLQDTVGLSLKGVASFPSHSVEGREASVATMNFPVNPHRFITANIEIEDGCPNRLAQAFVNLSGDVIRDYEEFVIAEYFDEVLDQQDYAIFMHQV